MAGQMRLKDGAGNDVFCLLDIVEEISPVDHGMLQIVEIREMSGLSLYEVESPQGDDDRS